jgi:hypothetical protein
VIIPSDLFFEIATPNFFGDRPKAGAGKMSKLIE